MKNLFAPWRSVYATDSSDTKKENINKNACLFCAQLTQNKDETHFILK